MNERQSDQGVRSDLKQKNFFFYSKMLGITMDRTEYPSDHMEKIKNIHTSNEKETVDISRIHNDARVIEYLTLTEHN